MSISKRIKTFREEKGLSIRQLATGSGMSHTYISSIENGKHQPSVTALNSISDALGVPLVYLLTDEESVNSTFNWFFDLPTDIQDFISDKEARPYLDMAYSLYKNGLSGVAMLGPLLSLTYLEASKPEGNTELAKVIQGLFEHGYQKLRKEGVHASESDI